MEEYIILEKTKSEFQKVLNQWKHKYFVDILWMTVNYSEGLMDAFYYALIKRTLKERWRDD